ncbi:MAG: UvrD-helicase domain-containing protein, partial [Desulfobacterales bacterium]
DRKGSDALEAVIRQKYKAALVDEFQDTDTLQYDIFTKLFPSKQSILFMIGDPKQAIYGFRGADIFSYLKAARHANSTYTLLENWRSTPGLISAVNTLFSHTHNPFVFEQIRFDKGVSGKKTGPVQKQNSASLTLWYVGNEKHTPSHKSVSKSDAESLIAKAVAGEISRLTAPDRDQQHQRVSRRAKPGDIAILVRTNRQAQIIQKGLSSKQIPSVLYHTGNVFHTHEAMEIERILFSISEPNNEQRFRAALVTDAVGVVGKEIDLQTPEVSWWERRLINFKEYYRIWNQHGFIRMFRQFMTKEKVSERLLSFPDGERRLTNFLHLTEILHHTSLEKKTGMKGLLKWLSEQRSSRVPESEFHLLRLESDDEAVKIITMHRSKGLEYKIVFCPFAWGGSHINDSEIVFHNASQNKELTLDIGSNQMHQHVAYAQNERLAENLRLLYVALTRAIEHCYLVWGRMRSAESSALAYLFHFHLHAKDKQKSIDLVPSLSKTFLNKSDKDIYNDLQYLSKESEGAIEVVPMPLDSDIKEIAPPVKEEKISCRKFSGKIDSEWKISSYTYWVSQKIPEAEFPDRGRHRYDEWNIHEPREDVVEETDIFSFPKGVRAGIFFHDLFEHLDFASSDPNHQRTLVEDKLKAYGFAARWQKPVRSMLSNVLSMPIKTARKGKLTLNSIHREDRINEMEFYFPLNPITPRQLERIFHAHTDNDVTGFPERIESLAFPVSKGYMKGYIDLVFRHNGRYYILDWKSNFLGSRLENYNSEALDQMMSREYYLLQYHLYTLALHQYLRLRLPDYRYEKDFGGTIYMFIRGIDPDQSHEFGLYKDFPNAKLIHELGKSLIPGYDPN